MNKYSDCSVNSIKKSVKVILSSLLIFATAASLCVAAFAADINLNYSSPKSIVNKSLTAVQVVEYISGEKCTELEKTYLATIDSYVLTYTPVPDSSGISLSGVEDTLTVRVSDTTYKASNGIVVTWVPVLATIDVKAKQKSLELNHDDEVWKCKFTGLPEADEYSVTVTYEASFSLSPDEAASVINSAYNEGLSCINAEKDYNAALESYNKSKDAYEKYLTDMAEYIEAYQIYAEYSEKYEAYLEKKKAYDAYLDAVKNYDSNLAAYNEYKKLLAEYNTALEAYNAEVASMGPEFEKYNAYVKARNTYLSEVAAVMISMNALENCYVVSSAGHQLYATIMGGTVDSVLANKAKIIAGGGTVLEEYIETAGKSTNVLRTVMTEYNDIRETATDKEKFDWYTKNYKTLKDNITALYSSLKTLYSSSVVALGMSIGNEEVDTNDRTLRFCQFLGHLYVISTCMDDTVKTDVSGWYLKNKFIQAAYSKIGVVRDDWYYYLSDMFDTDPEYKITDMNNADPSKYTWPTEPAAVEKPVTVNPEPVMPKEVSEPKVPTPVSEPVPPSNPVAEPKKPTEVQAPGNKPEAPTFTSIEKSLMKAVREGDLIERKKPSKDVEIKRSCEVVKFLSGSDIGDYPMVTFRDYDLSVIKNVKAVEYKISAKDIPTPTVPANDETCTYKFNGWVGNDGKKFDFNNIQSDATVYPDISETAVKYTVTWVTASGTTKKEYKYGAVPSYKGKTEKSPDDGCYYTFAGWDKEITPVTKNVTYTAVYASDKRNYTVKWVIDNLSTEESYEYGEIPVCPVDTYSQSKASSDTEYYGFSGWDKEITAVTGDITYTAKYSSSKIAPAKVNGEDSALSVSSQPGKYVLTVPEKTTSIDLSYLVSKATGDEKNLALVFNERYTFTLPLSSFSSLSGGLILNFSEAETENSEFCGCFTFKSQSGTDVLLKDLEITADTSGECDYRCTVKNGEKWENVTLLVSDAGKTFDLNAGTEFAFTRLYAVKILSVKNGKIKSETSYAAVGEKVTLALEPDEGFASKNSVINWKTASGAPIVAEEDGISFIMPAEKVEVDYEFAPMICILEFYVEGVLYKTLEVNYGDKLVSPEAPTKADNGNIGYVFTGWTPLLPETVTESASFNANFSESDLAKVKKEKLLIPEWAYIFIVLIIILVVTLVLLKKRRRIR